MKKYIFPMSLFSCHPERSEGSIFPGFQIKSGMTKVLFTIMAIALCITQAKAFDEDLEVKKWNTASGKSYVIYKNLEWTQEAKAKAKKNAAIEKLFLISYITSQKPGDKKKLLEEYYDLMSHFYYFYAPEALKKKSAQEKAKYHVVVEALQRKPKPGEQNVKAQNFSKNFSGVERIVQNNESIDKTRLEALRQLNNRKYPQAIQNFEKIKNKVAYDFVHMANAYLYRVQRDQAKKKVEEGLKLFSKDHDLLHHLAYITILEGTYVTKEKDEFDPEKMNEAKKILSQLLKMDSNDYLAQSNLATVETTLKNYDEAEKIIKNLISKSSSPWMLQKRLGDLYVLQKKYDGAEKYYSEALQQLSGRSVASTEKNKKIDELKAELKKIKNK